MPIRSAGVQVLRYSETKWIIGSFLESSRVSRNSFAILSKNIIMLIMRTDGFALMTITLIEVDN